jgi:hypothetical protein
MIGLAAENPERNGIVAKKQRLDRLQRDLHAVMVAQLPAQSGQEKEK